MTLRNVFGQIKKDPVTLVTNMIGLSLGLAASILLTLYIQFELSFDQYFANSDRIFRLNSIWISQGERSVMPINLREAYTEIPQHVAGIESAIQIYRGAEREVSYGENRYKGLHLLYSDPGFFRLFDLKPVEGDLQTALSDPGSVVLTRDVASRIFGSESALDKAIEMGNETYTVTAVSEDVPPNTSFDFDMLMPMQSVSNLNGLRGLEFFTYYLMEPSVDQSSVLKTICDENTALLKEGFSVFQNDSFDSSIEPLTRLHLRSTSSWGLTPPGSMKTIMIMVIIVLIIMILALSNFINLFILNGAGRSGEIGIRKVNGARRGHLVYQFYLETTVVVTIAFIAGAVISLMLIPDFGKFMQRSSFTEVTSSAGLYLVIAVLYVTTILISGFYPALLLSKASPIHLIRGEVNPAGEKRLLLRIASIFQMAITLFLLTSLLGIHIQTRYLSNLSPGYDPEGIVLIYNLNNLLVTNYPSIRERLMEYPEIEQVAASDHTIGAGYSGQGIRFAGEPEDHVRAISEYRVQPGLCDLYRFGLVRGRFFDINRISDRNALILNESAVEMMGSTSEEIVGESMIMHEDPLQVIGVVRDFLFESAASEIDPLAITAYSPRFRVIAVRIHSGTDNGEILKKIDRTVRSFDPAYIMIHQFATDIYAQYYAGEKHLQHIMGTGSLFSLIIVLLGIFALVSHNILARTKEIGIRKVMGGTTRQMILMIYLSTLKWTGAAAVIATPLAWLYLNQWLKNYTVKIPLFWWIFVLPVCLVIMIQTLVSLGQTWKAASRNPVESLRYE